MSKSNVVLKNITKEYVSPNKSVFCAVDDISLEIQAGQFVTLLGPSGCGKTTTLRMVAGFENPTQGEIWLGDTCINEQTPDKRDTAMVFQSYALFPHYDVYNNIAYGLRLKKMPDKQIKQKCDEMISLVGLEGLQKRFPNQISGGQQQRVALARALVMEPAVMLFDEPLSNLDAKLRVYMRNEIRKIQRRLGVTSIYVTHDQAEAMSLSDQIIIMNKGIIEQIGSPEEVYLRPATKFVADFIGRANFVNGKIVSINENSYGLELMGSTICVNKPDGKDYSRGDKVVAVIRPESMGIGDYGQFDGVVSSSTFMGESQEYFVNVGDETFYAVEYDPFARKVYAEGESVKLQIREQSVHIVDIDLA